jgi:hypothetical protein
VEPGNYSATDVTGDVTDDLKVAKRHALLKAYGLDLSLAIEGKNIMKSMIMSENGRWWLL